MFVIQVIRLPHPFMLYQSVLPKRELDGTHDTDDTDDVSDAGTDDTEPLPEAWLDRHVDNMPDSKLRENLAHALSPVAPEASFSDLEGKKAEDELRGPQKRKWEDTPLSCRNTLRSSVPVPPPFPPPAELLASRSEAFLPSPLHLAGAWITHFLLK